MSSVGVGGCVVGGGIYADKGELEEVCQSIETAIRSGLNYVDTSPFYGEGRSEQVLGLALRRVPRHTYYIATKVGRYGSSWETAFDFSPSRILAEFEESLRRLQLHSVDVIQIHDFEFSMDPARMALETLPVLESIVRSGKARYIGITGYPLQDFHEVLDRTETKVDTVLTYARNLMVCNTLQDHLPYFHSKHLGIINGSPTAMGLFTNTGPQPWHPACQELKDIVSKARSLCISRGVELGKLSVWHNINNPDIHITLLGFGNLTVLKLNMDVVLHGLTTTEEEVYRELLDTVFSSVPPSLCSWESVEIEQYKKAVQHTKE